MFQYCFIDLDDTLFETYLFKRDIFRIFSECGVSKADYEKTYRRAVFGSREGYFDYTFGKHAGILRELGYAISDAAVERLEKLLENDYNDPEAGKFLSDLKKISQKIILLTAGEKKMQEKKIFYSGLAGYFDEVAIIDGGKTQKILEIAGAALKIVFINDNLTENEKIKRDLPYVLVVAKKHRDLWPDDDYARTRLPFFDTLTQIGNYVAQFA